MFAKNTCQKAIGFGSLILLPDETKELPAGFDENHPSVKFFLARGWLTAKPVKAAKPAKPAKAAAEQEVK